MSRPTPDSTPRAGAAHPGAPSGLSVELREEAARRLAWTGLPVAILLATFQGMQQIVYPDYPFGFGDPINRLLSLLIILVGGGLYALYHYRVAPAATLFTLGMVFEAAVAFVVSMGETASHLWHLPFRGISAVGPWTVFMGAFVPNTPRVSLVIALVSASMWPLAYFINHARFGYHDVGWGPVLLWPLINYMMAIVAWLVSRWTYGTARDAQVVEELGSYRLVGRLGEGGMGEVWSATHRMLARSAAIKLVRPETVAGVSARQSDAFFKRFRREANAIASLQSPHTVYLYDFGVSADGRLYYVMELLDGISLQALVTHFGPQPPSRVVAILDQACQSLDEAHALKLVHRDLKPSNLMICKVARTYDFVKVLDFGLAKSLTPVDETQLTVTGTATGTPGYMAPEVVMGEHIDGRADLYALGCVAYFLLTGTQVFDDPNPTNLALKHVQTTPDPPSTRTELAIPTALEQIVLTCLAKRPAARPESAAALRALLRDAAPEPWTDQDAARWWQVHLPPTSSLRKTPAVVSAEMQAVRKV
jgi:serine/threonine-protein kinase